MVNNLWTIGVDLTVDLRRVSGEKAASAQAKIGSVHSRTDLWRP